MSRASQIKAAGSWTERAADTIVLDFDERHRRRIAMKTVRGLDFLLELPEATVLHNGDALLLDDGRLIEVVASPEPLVEIRCANTKALLRAAWHLGNRHLPVEVAGQRLRIRQDHVIEDMLRGLGASLRRIEAPFDPEGGAYGETTGAHQHVHAPYGTHAHHRHDDGHGH